MGKSFLNYYKPMLTVMLQCGTPETAIKRIRNSICQGADAYGLQVESLRAEYHDPDTYKRIFGEMGDKPCYVTNYRSRHNTGLTDEQLADGLVTIAECGGTLCDVMGDMFCRHPEEMTDNADAITKQMRLIDKIHALGGEVLMSSHVKKYMSAERVLEIAHEQKRRGADIVKIVTHSGNMDEQIENMRITALLKKELDIPFLHLCGGESSIHRRLGGKLGNCMTLCVYEHDAMSTAAQPLLSMAKAVRDDMGF